MQGTLATAPTLLSVVDLTQRYGVSQATIWRWRENGTLPSPVKIGPQLVRWTGESIEMKGLGYEARGNTMAPRPTQVPHPPIWVGGNSPRAIRRAVDYAQGWSPFPLPAAGTRRTRTTSWSSP